MNKPGAQGDKKNVIRVIIVDDIPETRENLKKLLAFESDIEVVGTAGTGKEGVELARSVKPDIVLMDINMPDMDGIQATEQISKAVGAVGVIMMSVQHEADYLRRAMLAGARDFLTKPIAGDELYATIRRVYEIPKSGPVREPEEERDRTDHNGHVIMVYSPQGGVGKTTVATNLAAALMRPDTKVLLIDADLQFGDVGVFLNLVAQASIVNLVKTATEAELDFDLVENVLIKHDTGLKVLLAPPTPQDAENVPPETVLQLIPKLKGLFDFIVVDTATRLDDLNLGLFDIAERIILVMVSTLPALKNTRAVLNVLDALKYPDQEKIALVFNRVNADYERTKIVPPVAALEDRLKRKALLSIPVDERKVLTALTRGTPVFAGKDRTSSPAKEFLTLAETLRAGLMPEELEPVAGPVKSSSRLSRLLGG